MRQPKRLLLLKGCLTAIATLALLLGTSTGAIAAPSNTGFTFPLPETVSDGTTIRIDGSDLMTTINRVLKQQFEATYPGASVDLEERGTDTAIQELLDGEIDLAAIGRSLTDIERARGLLELPMMIEKIGIIVGRDNPFNGSLTLEQLAQIAAGQITDWAEVGRAAGPIRFIDRPATSDTRWMLERYGILAASSPQVKELAHDPSLDKLPTEENTPTPEGLDGQLLTAEAAEPFPGEATNSDAAPTLAPAESLPNREPLTDDTSAIVRQLGQDGISYAIASQVNSLPEVKFVQLAIVLNTLPGDVIYPYAQPRNYAFRADALNTIAPFLGFATAEPGQAAVKTARIKEARAIATALLPPRPQPKSLPDLALVPASEPAASKDIPLWLWLTVPALVLLLILPFVLKRFQSQPPKTIRVTREEQEEPNTPLASSSSRGGVNPLDDVPPEQTLTATTEASTSSQQPPSGAGISPAKENLEENPDEHALPNLLPPSQQEAVVPAIVPPEAAIPSPQNDTLANAVTRPSPAVNVQGTAQADLSPNGRDRPSLSQAMLTRLVQLGTTPQAATPRQLYLALAEVVSDRLFHLNTAEAFLELPTVRIVAELSVEFMPGPHLSNNLISLGWMEEARQLVKDWGQDWRAIAAEEEEPGLGRGGLGRLMVCCLDSLATANVPTIGYGLRYEYGFFDQEIRDGWQVEIPDTWLQAGNGWERERRDRSVTVQFGGYTEAYVDQTGRYRGRWVAFEAVRGVPYDTPIPGYRSSIVSLMRLWKAEGANLCSALYPVDEDGGILRLKQQFFLVSCALQDAIRLHLSGDRPIIALPEKFALHLNDTDTALAVLELMRLLLDDYGQAWDTAWAVTLQTLSYTNHSLMPETLDDRWSLDLLGRTLPRHLEIAYEINARMLEEVQHRYPNDGDRVRRMSLIEEVGDRGLRLNHLACVGTHAINGISPLHTSLLKERCAADFYDLTPERFHSILNGVTPRRFLRLTNPRLSSLLTRHLGEGWIKNLTLVNRLEELSTHLEFQQDWQRIKLTAKQHLAALIQQHQGITVNPHSLFDVQAMVIHEYKRQHLNVLHILTLYNRIKANPAIDLVPRTFIFSGKAAADYDIAKRMIKLIHAVAELVNGDADINGRLNVVFIPDFSIKVLQSILPATDLSEHLSLAGTEACDTGNMMSALNGAVIIGTPDGSNVEIRAAVGAENFFQFGLTVQDVANLHATGFSALDIYNSNAELRQAIALLTSEALAPEPYDLFNPLVNILLHQDRYLLLADYQDYIATQERVSEAYRDSDRWTRMSILNTARAGAFSSDRTIRAYGQFIWNVNPVPAALRHTRPIEADLRRWGIVET